MASVERQATADGLLEVMADLAQAGNAVDLRIGRLAAWVRHRDPAELGYASHTAILREHIGWGRSWLRDIVRLVESDLTAIQAAVCLGKLPLSVAVKAPGRVVLSQQAFWLQGALAGDLGGLPGPVGSTRKPRPAPVPCVDLERAQLRDIHQARRLARLVAGQPLSDAQADAFVLSCWRRRADGSRLLARAKLDPPPPPERPAPGWCGLPDPATPILGPWVQPRNLAHALELLEAAQVARGSRVVLLGQAFDQVATRALHRELGFHSLRELARDGLGYPLRQLERHRRLARDLRCLPALAAAIDAGLDLARARLVASIACEDTVDAWLAVARSTGIAELQRAVKLAGRGDAPGLEAALLERYQQAMDLAAELMRKEQDARATNPGAKPRIRVSVRAAWAPHPVPGFDRVPADLPVAARWFLQEVKLEPQRGFGRVKERDDHRCQNPECRRRSLRVQAHHIVYRSAGGCDDPSNGITLCPVCHLRLVHTGRISVTREGDALVWRYPGRVVVAL